MIKLSHSETRRNWLKLKIKGQGTSDKSELSQSGEASDELSAWLSGPGRPHLWDWVDSGLAVQITSGRRVDKTEERSDHSPSTE